MKGRANNTSEEDYGDYTTRCICSYTHDDGYMICCDECSVWQHVECMKVDPENLPDKYLCELCEPRPTDQKRARMIQFKKKEEMSGTDFDDDDSANMSADDSHRSLSSSPGPASSSKRKKSQKMAGTLRVQELKAEARRTVKREKSVEKQEMKKGKKKPKHHKVHSPNSSPLPSMLTGVQTLLTAASALEQQQLLTTPTATPSPWSSSVSPWSDPYESIDTNRYTEPLRMSLSSRLLQLKQEAVVYSREEYLSLGPHPVCAVKEVTSCREGVVADCHIPEDEMIIEYKGRIATRQGLLAEMGLSTTRLLWKNKPCPFIYQYDKVTDVPICIDARHYGNMARFIRRSCSPNAELRHFFVNNEVHFGVNAVHYISPDEEITIGFDFHDKCDYSLECACDHKTSCLLINSPRQVTRPLNNKGGGGGRNKKLINEGGGGSDHESHNDEETFQGKGHSKGRGYSTHTLDEDVSGWHGNKRMRQTLGTQQQTSRDVTDSDSEDNMDSDTPKRRKSREERKTEAVWKMFEKMEASKRRRQHLLSESSHDGDLSPSTHRNSSNGRNKVRLMPPTGSHKLRISSVSSIEMHSPEPMDAFHSPPLTPCLSYTSLQDVHSDIISSPPPLPSSVTHSSSSTLPKLSFEVTPYLHPKYLLANFALPRKKAILHQWEMEQYEQTMESNSVNGFALAYAKSAEGHKPRMKGTVKHRWMQRYEERENTAPSSSSTNGPSFIHYKKKFLYKWENDLVSEKTHPLSPPTVTMATDTSSLFKDNNVSTDGQLRQEPVPSGQESVPSEQEPKLSGPELIPSGQEPILLGQEPIPVETDTSLQSEECPRQDPIPLRLEPIPVEEHPESVPLPLGQDPIPPVQEPVPIESILSPDLVQQGQDPVPSPGQDPIPLPVQDPITPPKQDPITPPGQDPIPSPGQAPVPSPEQDPIPSPIQDPIPLPVQDPIPLSGQDPIPLLGQDPIPQEQSVPSSPLFDDFSDDDEFEDTSTNNNRVVGVVKSLHDLAKESQDTTAHTPEDTPAAATDNNDETSLDDTPPLNEYDDKREDEMDISLTPPPPPIEPMEEEPHPLTESDNSMIIKGSGASEIEAIRLVDDETNKQQPAAKRKMSLLEYRNRSKRPTGGGSPSASDGLMKPVGTSSIDHQLSKSLTVTSPLPPPPPSTSPLTINTNTTTGTTTSTRSLLSFSSSFLSNPLSQRQTQGSSSLGGVANSEGGAPQFEPISPDEQDLDSLSKTTPLSVISPPIATSSVLSSSYGMTTPTAPGQFVWPSPIPPNMDTSQDPRNRMGFKAERNLIPNEINQLYVVPAVGIPQHHELFHQTSPQVYPSYLPPPPSLVSPRHPPPTHQIMMSPHRPTGYVPHPQVPHPSGPRHYQ